MDHTIALAKDTNIDKIVLAGGVSANSKLRELLNEQGNINGIKIK